LESKVLKVIQLLVKPSDVNLMLTNDHRTSQEKRWRTVCYLRKNICKGKCQFLRRKFHTTFIGIETETLLKNIPRLVLHANAFQDFFLSEVSWRQKTYPRRQPTDYKLLKMWFETTTKDSQTSIISTDYMFIYFILVIWCGLLLTKYVLYVIIRSTLLAPWWKMYDLQGSRGSHFVNSVLCDAVFGILLYPYRVFKPK
jgi:hypothetical protein